MVALTKAGVGQGKDGVGQGLLYSHQALLEKYLLHQTWSITRHKELEESSWHLEFQGTSII